MRKSHSQLVVIENKKTGALVGKFTEDEVKRIIEGNREFDPNIKYYSTKASKTEDILFVNVTVHGTYTVRKTQEDALACNYGSGCSVKKAVIYYRRE